MTQLGYESDDNEFAVAIAASAHAIHSSEQTRNLQKQITMGNVRKQEHMIRPPPPPSGSSLRKNDSFVKPAPCFGEVQRKKDSSRRRFGNFNTRVDAWERCHILKIRKRYEKMISEIVAWENTKKINVKNRMEKKKNELEVRKSRNWKHYQSKIARIDHIADSARTQVEEKTKQNEATVKDKARKMRSTQKTPLNYCFCFCF